MKKLSKIAISLAVITLIAGIGVYLAYANFSAGTTSKGLVGEWSLSKEDSKTGADLHSSAFINLVGAPYDTLDGISADGFHAIYSTGTGNQIVASADEIPYVTGEYYVAYFTAVLTSGQAPVLIPRVSGGGAIIGDPFTYTVIAGENQYVFSVDQTTTGTIGFQNTANAEYTISDFVIKDVTGTILDKTPNSNAGTRVGTTWTTDQHGQADKALAFDGTTDYVDLSSTDFITDFENDTKGSISAWFKTSDAGGHKIITSIAKGASSQDFMSLYCSSNSTIIFELVDVGVREIQIATDSGGYEDNNWHNVVITQDGIAAKMYIDGVLQSAVTLNSGDWLADLSSLSSAYIGVRDISGSFSNYFDGSLGETKYYSGRALTQTEITTLYNFY